MCRMCRLLVLFVVLSNPGAASAAPEVTQTAGKPNDVEGVAAVMGTPWQWMPFAFLAALSIPAAAFALQAVVGGYRLRSLARCIAAATQQEIAVLESSVRDYSRLLDCIDTTMRVSLAVGACVSAAKLMSAMSLLGAAPLGDTSAQIAKALIGTVVATSVFVILVLTGSWLSAGLNYLEEEIDKVECQRLAAPRRGQTAAQRGQVPVHTEGRQQRSSAIKRSGHRDGVLTPATRAERKK